VRVLVLGLEFAFEREGRKCVCVCGVCVWCVCVCVLEGVDILMEIDSETSTQKMGMHHLSLGFLFEFGSLHIGSR